MGWSAEDIPDQTGRVGVVTGANEGLGLEVSRELARKGAHVIMAARDPATARAAHADILETVPGASIELVELDLGSLASVRRAAARILERHARIDILPAGEGRGAVHAAVRQQRTAGSSAAVPAVAEPEITSNALGRVRTSSIRGCPVHGPTSSS